jgi:hypothetical protein
MSWGMSEDLHTNYKSNLSPTNSFISTKLNVLGMLPSNSAYILQGCHEYMHTLIFDAIYSYNANILPY